MRPGSSGAIRAAVDFEQLDLQQCRDSWEGAWIKHEARQELF